MSMQETIEGKLSIEFNPDHLDLLESEAIHMLRRDRSHTSR